MSIKVQLEDLLKETVDDVVCRERSAFDELTGHCGKSLVLFGAGGLGRKTLAGLRRMDICPLAFSDNNPDLWGQEIDGVPILAPEDAARRLEIRLPLLSLSGGQEGVIDYPIRKINYRNFIAPTSSPSLIYAGSIRKSFCLITASICLLRSSQSAKMSLRHSDSGQMKIQNRNISHRLTSAYFSILTACLHHLGPYSIFLINYFSLIPRKSLLTAALSTVIQFVVSWKRQTASLKGYMR